MYCQQCGAEVGEAKFCRKCGTPSGIAGLSLTQAAPSASPDYEKGFKKLFMGLAFLVIAILPVFTIGKFWWWMLIPAATLLAAGLARLVRSHSAPALPAPTRAASLSAVQGQIRRADAGELPRARDTAELLPLQPPSITEGTTRLLDKERAQGD